MLFHQIQFYPFFRRTIRASSLFIRKKNFIYNFLRYLLSVFKVKFFQLCICFFRHTVNTKLFDLQFVTDRFDSRQSTVKFRNHCIDCACGENRFARVVISGMSVKHIFIMRASKLEILSDTSTSDKLKPFCSRLFCLFRNIRICKPFLKICKHRMLMSCNHNIDIIRIDHPQTDRSQTKLRFSEHDIIQKIRQCQPVNTCRNSKFQTIF